MFVAFSLHAYEKHLAHMCVFRVYVSLLSLSQQRDDSQRRPITSDTRHLISQPPTMIPATSSATTTNTIMTCNGSDQTMRNCGSRSSIAGATNDGLATSNDSEQMAMNARAASNIAHNVVMKHEAGIVNIAPQGQQQQHTAPDGTHSDNENEDGANTVVSRATPVARANVDVQRIQPLVPLQNHGGETSSVYTATAAQPVSMFANNTAFTGGLQSPVPPQAPAFRGFYNGGTCDVQRTDYNDCNTVYMYPPEQTAPPFTAAAPPLSQAP